MILSVIATILAIVIIDDLIMSDVYLLSKRKIIFLKTMQVFCAVSFVLFVGIMIINYYDPLYFSLK